LLKVGLSVSVRVGPSATDRLIRQLGRREKARLPTVELLPDFPPGRAGTEAGAPVDRVIAVSGPVQPLDRGTEAIRVRRPRGLVVVTHHVHVNVGNKNPPG